MLLAAILSAAAAIACMLPAGALAHPGHQHPSADRFDGRLPGQPDVEHIRGVTTRFNPKSEEYIIEKPGLPPMRGHVESDEVPTPESAEALGAYHSLPSFENKPTCATSGHRIVFVRSYEEGTGTPNEEDALIRSIVRRMNWKFIQQSEIATNGSRILEMKVNCNAGGEIEVADVEVPFNHKGPGVDTTDGDISLADTFNHVANTLGWPKGAEAVKYVMLNDKSTPGFVGIAYPYRDPDKSSSDEAGSGGTANPAFNSNRSYSTGGFVSRTAPYTLDGKDGWESMIPIHELLHAMGAAFYAWPGDPVNWVSAPYANSGWHCVDGIDILCYESGSSAEGTYTETRCPESEGYNTSVGAPLDCGFDTYFDPVSEPGEWLDKWWNVGGPENPYLVEQEPTEAVESDVGWDERSDLVTVDSEGTAHVFGGLDTGIETAASTDSLTQKVDPALYDRAGHYVIDTTDVTGEGRADLVTLDSGGNVHVHLGTLYNTFAEQGAAALTGLKPVMNGSGSFEPVAIADVTGDGRGDLVGIDHSASQVNAFPGQAGGTFGTKVATTGFSLDSALLDGSGRYALDVADVTGDGRADLVTMDANGTTYVYQGQADGKFASPTSAASINPIFDDGSGEEPVGMGDVDLDGKADLLTLAGTTPKLYKGKADGTFATATNPYAGSINSSLLDGSGQELVGLLDYNRDGRADLVSINGQGDVLAYTAQSGAFFTAPTTHSGSITTTQHDLGGQELASEKPFLRRRGEDTCSATGCKWPQATAVEDDVDGNGRSDLVTVDAEGTAHVFRGTSAGIEAATSTDSLGGLNHALHDGNGNYLIEVADMDRDGQDDLVTIHSSGGVNVHHGSADRTFGPAVQALGTSLKPIMNGAGSFEPVGVADVTGDGNLDLVGVDHSASRVNTFPGQADGTFGTKVTSSFTANSALLDGTGDYMVDVGDVNGDGRADLVMLATTPILGLYAKRYKGQTDGTFSGLGYGTGGNPIFDDGSGEEPVGLADVSADGRADLLTLDGTTLKLRMGLPESSGGFAAPATAYAGSINSSLLDGSGEELVGLLDYSRDGRPDLVSVNDQGDVLTYAAQSNSTFAAPTTHPGSITTTQHGLGGQELASEKPFLRRRGEDTCSATGCKWSQAMAAEDDVDGNGRSDLVTVDSGGTAHVFRGISTGIEAASSTDSLANQLNPALNDGNGNYLIDTADVDMDGQDDLVTIHSSGGVYVHRGRTDRTFGSASVAMLSQLVPVRNGGSIEPIAVADVDGDGNNDLTVHSKSSSSLSVYLNQGNGTFGSTPVSSGSSIDSAQFDGSGSYFLDLADVNGDDRADSVALDTSGSATVRLGQADGTFQSATTAASIDPIMDNGSGEEPVGMGDVDLDGKADLLTLAGTTLKLYKGKADGTFATATNPYAGSINSSLLDGSGEELVGLLDYSRDGRPDLVSVNDQGDVLAYTAQSNSTFAAPATQAGEIDSGHFSSTGQEVASEKPMTRRPGCPGGGCVWHPSAATQSATSIAVTSATVRGVVNPNKVSTTYQFEYGTTTAYGSKAPASPKSIGSGTEDVAVSEAIEGLKVHTTYHFRVLATNAQGTTYGKDETFTTAPEYLSTIGSKGSGNGQFESPYDIAAEPDGEFWVADYSNNRVQKFNSKGEYLSQFGSFGTGNGQFKGPVGVAITAAGDLWVTDSGNDRVQKFNSKGEYLSQFGSSGIGNGQFGGSPSGVTIAPDGHVWVSDWGYYRVQEFTASGEFLQSINSGYPSSPAGLAVDSEGDIWVANFGNENYVGEIDPQEGEYVTKFGSYGNADGKFEGLQIVEVLPSGNILAGDRYAGRVQEFTPSGQFVTKFGGAGQISQPNGLASAPGGIVYVSDTGNHRVKKYCIPTTPTASAQAASSISDTKATLKGSVTPTCAEGITYQFEYGTTTAYGSKAPASPKSIGSGTEDIAVSEALEGLKVHTTYHFRVVATNAQGTTYGEDKTFTTQPTYIGAFSSSGSSDGKTSNARGLAVEADGDVWVADSNNDRMQRFNSKGEYASKFGTSGSAAGQLDGPEDVAIDAGGNLWVADYNNARVQKFSTAGTLLDSFGSYGTGNGQFKGPNGVAISPDGHVWVSDGFGWVQEFDAEGNFVQKISGGSPWGIAADSAGGIWVVSSAGSTEKVRKIDPKTGAYVSEFGSEGSGNGQFQDLSAIEVMPSGNILTAERYGSRIQEFTPAGEYVTQFGNWPQVGARWGVAAGPSGEIYASDRYNQNLRKWSIGN